MFVSIWLHVTRTHAHSWDCDKRIETESVICYCNWVLGLALIDFFLTLKSQRVKNLNLLAEF